MLGKRIRELRKDLHLSGIELAEMAQISNAYLTELEKGKKNPSTEVLQSLAKALGTTSSYLLGEINSHPLRKDKQITGHNDKEPCLKDTSWKDFYEKLLAHNPDLEFWFLKEGANLPERDYKTLSNIILSFLKSSQEDN